MAPQHFSFLSGYAGIFGPFLRYESRAFNNCRNLSQWQTTFFQTAWQTQCLFIYLCVALGKQLQIEALGSTDRSLLAHFFPQVSILQQRCSRLYQGCSVMRGHQQAIQAVPDDFWDTACGKARNGRPTAQALDTDKRMIVRQCRVEEQIQRRIQTGQLGRLMYIGNMLLPSQPPAIPQGCF